ncbi:hypothetical protein V4B17_06320 [Bartonella sp. B23]
MKREKTIIGISCAIGGAISSTWEGQIAKPWDAATDAVMGVHSGYRGGKIAGFVTELVDKAIDCHGHTHW